MMNRLMVGVGVVLVLSGGVGSLAGQSGPDSARIAATSLATQAKDANHQGTREGLERAGALFSRAVALYRRAGDRSGEAETLTNIGAIYSDLGRPDSALAYYVQALPIWRTV